jgi:hypothetical protein
MKLPSSSRISPKKLNEAKNWLADFLRSREGTRLLFDLLAEALARGEVAPLIDSAEARLKSLAKDAEARLKGLAKEAMATQMVQAQLSLELSSEAHAAAVKLSAREAADNLADQIAHDVQLQLGSYRSAIVEVVKEQLPIMLREEVGRHVRSGPLFSPRWSNRALAAAHGISIREVKRRRRQDWF